MYCLEVAIAAEPVLRRLAGGEVLEGFWKAPVGFGRALAECSVTVLWPT